MLQRDASLLGRRFHRNYKGMTRVRAEPLPSPHLAGAMAEAALLALGCGQARAIVRSVHLQWLCGLLQGGLLECSWRKCISFVLVLLCTTCLCIKA